MTPSIFELVVLGLFGVFAALGLRSSWRLWRIWLHDDDSRGQLLLLTLAAIASVITAAALYFGILGLRRVLGFAVLPWSALGSIIVASAVLLIPAALELVVDRIGRGREGDPPP